MRTSAHQSEMQRATDAYRARVLAMEQQATLILSVTYQDALNELEPRIIALSKQIEEARANGEEPGISWLFQQERYQELRRQLLTLIDQYGQVTKVVTTQGQQLAIKEAWRYAGEILLPVSGGDGSELATMAAQWASVPDSSIIELVGGLQSGTPLDETIQSYGVDAVQDVQRALTRGLALGDSVDMTANVLQSLGITRTRAESLVRTETMRAARAATTAAYKASGVVQKVRWSAAISERTCAYCFTGDTLVSASRVRKGFSRYYRGDLVVIETASGKRLSATPNHPILTDAGWVAAELITVGSELATKRVRDGADIGGYEDDSHRPSAIQQVVESLPVILAEMPCTAPDFHGDGIGSDVYVVRTNRLLGNDVNTGGDQKPNDFGFTCGGSGELPSRGLLLPIQRLRNAILPTHQMRSVAIDQNGFPRTERHFGSPEATCLFQSSQRGFRVFQAGVDSLARNVQRLRQLKNTFSGKIAISYLGIRNANRPLVFGNVVSAASVGLLATAKQAAFFEDGRQERIVYSPNTSGGDDRHARNVGGDGRLNIASRTSEVVPSVDNHPATLESLSDDDMICLVSGHKRHHRFAGEIALDSVINVYRTSFSGHVYNLETETGWYVANGIIVHNCLSRHGKLFPVDYVMESHSNCRCSLSPWSPAWDEPWQSGESWLKEQPLTVQQDILGKLGAADFNAGNLQLSDFERTGFDKDWGPTGHFGGVGHARQVATKAGRAPKQWAELAPRQATDPPEMKWARQLYEKASKAEPQTTRDLQRISETIDGELFGLDFRLKTLDSTARKIATDAKAPGVTVEDAAKGIKDNLRYTYQLDPKNYGKSVQQVTAAMKDAGYTPVRFKNFWSKDEGYAGINTVWKTANGQYVEVQFNTADALYVKETLSHPLYERLRVLDDDSPEAVAIQSEISQLWAGVRKSPPSFGGLTDAERLYG